MVGFHYCTAAGRLGLILSGDEVYGDEVEVGEVYGGEVEVGEVYG